MLHVENDSSIYNLITRLHADDEKAFEALFRRYNSHICNFAYSILHDISIAQDITQTTFLKIWEYRTDIRPAENFEAYLFTIVRHLIYKEIKESLKAAVSMRIFEEDLPDIPDQSMEQELDARFTSHYLNTLIELLPEARRRIFKMSRMEHLSNKEIAKQLSISERTVETQLYRAIHFLRKHLVVAVGCLWSMGMPIDKLNF